MWYLCIATLSGSGHCKKVFFVISSGNTYRVATRAAKVGKRDFFKPSARKG